MSNLMPCQIFGGEAFMEKVEKDGRKFIHFECDG